MNADEKREYSRVYMAQWRLARPERMSAISARYKMKALAELADPTDPRHGKEGTYVLGCRCAECREAHRVSMSAYRARQKVAA